MRALGPGPASDADVLAIDSSCACLALPLGDTIPAAAANRQMRADALRSIAFDASAELELRAAYAATGEPRLLLEAAQEALNAGHCGAAIVTVRQIYPQLECAAVRPGSARSVARGLRAAVSNPSSCAGPTTAGVDPMLVAGLIRQESAYRPEAHSPANAFGLDATAAQDGAAFREASENPLRALRRLFEPDYNVHLGTLYFASLLQAIRQC